MESQYTNEWRDVVAALRRTYGSREVSCAAIILDQCNSEIARRLIQISLAIGVDYERVINAFWSLGTEVNFDFARKMKEYESDNQTIES